VTVTVDPLAATGRQPARIRVDESDRWVRGLIDGRVVVDSRRTLLVHESGTHPSYYFPLGDLGSDVFHDNGMVTDQDPKGPAAHLDLISGDRIVRDAARRYDDPSSSYRSIALTVHVDWGAVDQWFEEDEEIFFHARDPYRRVDALASSRRVEVHVDGVPVACSDRATLVFETGLPTRYYLPPTDVELTRLTGSDTVTGCQYKGTARYWRLRDDDPRRDVAWSYPAPFAQVHRLAGLIAFDQLAKGIDIVVDGEPVPKPPIRPAWLDPSLHLDTPLRSPATY
jgi:uncharacterized protein (DUF427 family)